MRFGFTPKRRRLLAELRAALVLLKHAGCRRVYIDGSFVTTKPDPGDIGVYWAIAGIEPDMLNAVFLDFSESRAQQKTRFLCEFFPADVPGRLTGTSFLEFVQIDKATGRLSPRT